MRLRIPYQRQISSVPLLVRGRKILKSNSATTTTTLHDGFLRRRRTCTSTTDPSPTLVNIRIPTVTTSTNTTTNEVLKWSRSSSTASTTSAAVLTNAVSHRRVVDLRSDTVTAPSPAMLQTCLQASTGDDVMGEDPTVQELQHCVADLFHKECGLYVPTSTMANLIAIMAHCQIRSSDIIIGSQSHIALWEAGNVSSLANVFPKMIPEQSDNGQFHLSHVRDVTNLDDGDVHVCKTQLLCLENTHNMLGGIALSVEYMNEIGSFCRTELQNLPIHLDGARICNAALALNVPVHDLCHSAQTVSVCLSKGLGAPVGSVLVGDAETIRLAKRARKRCGGGMRQAGVIAAMGLYAIQNNVHRLRDDHHRAQRFASTLMEHGFQLMRNGQVDTNIVYFQLPRSNDTNGTVKITKEAFQTRLFQEYGVKVTGGYSSGGNYFRAVTHLDINDDDIAHAANAMVELCYR
jgi:threonine aldolase